MEEKMSEKIEKLLQKINNKLDALILLDILDDLKGEDKLKILKHSINIRTAAKILDKDPANFKKSIKKKESKIENE